MILAGIYYSLARLARELRESAESTVAWMDSDEGRAAMRAAYPLDSRSEDQ
jgi:hypothetical protein